MQLDNTRIVIRERGNSELLDLTFHVLRTHFAQLTLLLLLGALPFALMNGWLVGWLALPSGTDYVIEEYLEANMRYLWAMLILVFLQAPLATSLVTIYMGQAVFVDRPQLRSVFEDLRRLGGRQLWCQGIVRLAIPVTLLTATLDRTNPEFQPGIELGVLGMAALIVAIVRSVRPYVSEIVLLERNPVFSWQKGAMTVSRRSRMLHGTNSGDLFSRWLGAALASALLFCSLGQFFLFLQGVFLNDWTYHTWFMLHIGFPLTLWLVSGYIAVYRFLSYLNLRIHNEGWEVDLLLRAEATRLQESPILG